MPRMSNEWQQRYESNDTPWEKGVPHPALVDFLQRHPIRGCVLIPGCGKGHDVRAVAATADEVVGLDIAAAAIAAAKTYPEIGGERYVVGDLFNLPKSMHGVFDWVVEHTCFCAIPLDQRPNYERSVAAALRPGGHLLAIFFLNPDLDPGETGPPFGTTTEELDVLFSQDFDLLAEWPTPATYPGRENRELCRLLKRI
jgi:SAM-dependent methyltransferase